LIPFPLSYGKIISDCSQKVRLRRLAKPLRVQFGHFTNNMGMFLFDRLVVKTETKTLPRPEGIETKTRPRPRPRQTKLRPRPRPSRDQDKTKKTVLLKLSNNL